MLLSEHRCFGSALVWDSTDFTPAKEKPAADEEDDPMADVDVQPPSKRQRGTDGGIVGLDQVDQDFAAWNQDIDPDLLHGSRWIKKKR